MLKQLAHVATLPTIQLGMRVYLLTMVRKSEPAGRNLGRGGFRERGLDHSEGENEALESVQRLSVTSSSTS